ncbi:MAG: YhjD/YihY/BrkB family envelope integrity protein [bacterium]
MKRLEKATTPFRRALKFLGDGVWDIEMSSLTGLRRLGVKAVRVVHLVVKGFVDDQCPLHASSLTFSTLMSIVPVLAVSLALARGLGAGDNFEVWCREKAREVLIEKASTGVLVQPEAGSSAVAGQAGAVTVAVPEEVPAEELAGRMDNLIEQLFESIGNVSFAKLGGVGLLILVWSVVQVLGRVESSFNKVWGVTSGRPLFRKVLDYLSVLIIVPILAIAASSLPALSAISKLLDPSGSGHLTTIVAAVKMKGLIVVGMATGTDPDETVLTLFG